MASEIEQLLQGLRSGNRAAGEAPARLGPPAVPALCQALSDPPLAVSATPAEASELPIATQGDTPDSSFFPIATLGEETPAS